MRTLSSLLVLCLSTILIGTSCKKQTAEQECEGPPVPRKIQFSLYTDKDFSGYNSNIVFTLSIRKSTGKVLWDSVLSAMQIKDIPDAMNKLVIEKTVPGNDSSPLKAGFIYAIEHVGISWFWDHSNPCDTFKRVDFNFR